MKPDFLAAAKPLVTKEGPYSNDPGDDGGETVWGQIRTDDAGSGVWPLVDALKARGLAGKALSAAIVADGRILDAALAWFKLKYWVPLGCDSMPVHGLAMRLLDMGVNLGIPMTARYLQASLNYMNRQGTLYPDMAVDGHVGPGTLAAVGVVGAKTNGSLTLWKLLNGWNAVALNCGYKVMVQLLENLKSTPPPASREEFTWGLVLNRTYDENELHSLN